MSPAPEPVVVATHGLGDSRTCFEGQQPALESLGFGLVRWDLPGHGEHRDQAADFGPKLARAALAAVVEAHDRPVVLMGHSLGGYLSLAYAIANPTRVDRLVLVSTGPGYRNPHARTEWNGYIDGASASMDLFPGAGKLAHQVDSSVIDGLGDVRVPVLVIAGEDDRRYDAGVDYMMRAIADVELFRVPGAQHHPQRTATNEVNARLMTFLSRQRAVASSGR